MARLLLIIQPKPIRKTFPMGEALHFTPDEARQEEERAKSTSCPGAQTSTRRALWSCTQLSPFLLVSVGFTSRPCPVEQLLPGRDFTARPSPARQTTPFLFFFFLRGNEPAAYQALTFSLCLYFFLFFPSSPVICAHCGRQELLPESLTEGLRGSNNSLHLHNRLRSQTQILNPGLATLCSATRSTRNSPAVAAEPFSDN